MTDLTYLSDIELTDETLEHYGVPGMKWGVRKDPYQRIGRARRIADTGTGTRGSVVRRASSVTPKQAYAQRNATPSSRSTDKNTTVRTNDPTKQNWNQQKLKTQAKSTTSSLLSSAAGTSSKSKKSGKKSGKSEAQKAKEKAEKEAAKKKKQEEREAAKKKKAEETAARKAAREAEKVSKKETSGEKGTASNKSQQKEDSKLSAEKQKKLEEQTQKYIDYLEKRIKDGEAEKKFVYNPPSQERLRKKWVRNQRSRGMRHDDMENGAIMIFPEELKKPGIDELFNKEGSD